MRCHQSGQLCLQLTASRLHAAAAVWPNASSDGCIPLVQRQVSRPSISAAPCKATKSEEPRSQKVAEAVSDTATACKDPPQSAGDSARGPGFFCFVPLAGNRCRFVWDAQCCDSGVLVCRIWGERRQPRMLCRWQCW